MPTCGKEEQEGQRQLTAAKTDQQLGTAVATNEQIATAASSTDQQLGTAANKAGTEEDRKVWSKGKSPSQV